MVKPALGRLAAESSLYEKRTSDPPKQFGGSEVNAGRGAVARSPLESLPSGFNPRPVYTAL